MLCTCTSCTAGNEENKVRSWNLLQHTQMPVIRENNRHWRSHHFASVDVPWAGCEPLGHCVSWTAAVSRSPWPFMSTPRARPWVRGAAAGSRCLTATWITFFYSPLISQCWALCAVLQLQELPELSQKSKFQNLEALNACISRLCAAWLCGKVRLHSERFCIPSMKGLRTKPFPQHTQKHFNDCTACAKLGNLIWCHFVTWKPKGKALFPVTNQSHPSAFRSLLCEAFHLCAPLFSSQT